MCAVSPAGAQTSTLPRKSVRSHSIVRVSRFQWSLPTSTGSLESGMALTLQTFRGIPTFAHYPCCCPIVFSGKFLSGSLASCLLSCHRILQLSFTDSGGLSICPPTFQNLMHYILRLCLFSLTHRTLSSCQSASILYPVT